METKKFLDQAGVQYLWSKLSLEDYPNNQDLITVINAIDETKADKTEVIEINTKLAGKSDTTHTHDERYYTETEVDNKIEEAVDGIDFALKCFQYFLTAETEGQTEFAIPMETFDVTTDTIMVQSGITMMFPGEDFTVVGGRTLTMTEGVPAGRTIGIYIFKNVEVTNVEGDTISGSIIADGSIPLAKLSANLNDLFATDDHTHTEYAANNHTHTEYAPTYTYGTTDLQAGVSKLAKGTIHLVYEE